jgi:NADH-quinone oxidoreductase subunit H
MGAVLIEVLIKICVMTAVIGLLINIYTSFQGRFLTLTSMGEIHGEIKRTKFLKCFALLIKFFSQQTNKKHLHSELFYRLAPAMILFVTLLPYFVIPLCQNISFQDKIFPSEICYFPFGLLIAYGFSSLTYFFTVLGALGKSILVSRIGALRVFYQQISADLMLLLVLLSIFYFHNSADIHAITVAQNLPLYSFVPAWNIFLQPLGGVVFFLVILVRCGQAPFRLTYDNAELGEGARAAYPSTRYFILWFSEKCHFILWAIILVFLFLGGYGLLPGLEWVVAKFSYTLFFLQAGSLLLKVVVVLYIAAWLGHSISNFKNDHLISWSWNKLFPLVLANWFLVMVYKY